MGIKLPLTAPKVQVQEQKEDMPGLMSDGESDSDSPRPRSNHHKRKRSHEKKPISKTEIKRRRKHAEQLERQRSVTSPSLTSMLDMFSPRKGETKAEKKARKKALKAAKQAKRANGTDYNRKFQKAREHERKKKGCR